ncbi:hypothetical protein [Brucella sp. NBRC 12950]|uniref:hypothetical protein n=1 Tax=Brucella sp. NBRC 12950 TaxID=2994518 RepID=UPI0024A3F6D9|nr:hypothetical protein [Brucella sp. NBRC 12950]GLU29318.1 hypothetical protein Brsp01_45510 [Brucella sp. NBRC 12950]
MVCVAGLFDNYDEAANAVHALAEAGIAEEDTCLLTNNFSQCPGEVAQDVNSSSAHETTSGSLSTQLAAGQKCNTLSAVGLVVLPGIGQIAAYGFLTASLASLAGAFSAETASANLVDTLLQNGISERSANTVCEALRRGSTLVLVKCSEKEQKIAEATLDDWARINIDARRDSYIAEGLTLFDHLKPAMSTDELQRDQRLRMQAYEKIPPQSRL